MKIKNNIRLLLFLFITSCTQQESIENEKTCKEYWQDNYNGIAYLTNTQTGQTCSYEAVLGTGKGFTSEVGLIISIKPKTTGYCFYFQDKDYWTILTYCDPNSVDDEFISDTFRTTIRVVRQNNGNVIAYGKYYEKDNQGNMTQLGEMTFEYN